MRFLLDQNQSPALVGLLGESGHDAVHVRQLGLSEADDARIMQVAVEQGRVVLSGDTDFGELLARTNASAPSVMLLRRQDHRRAAQIAELIVLNLDLVAADLEAGAVVVLDEDRILVRRLPFRPES